MSFAELKKHLKSGAFEHVYVMYGKERYLREYYSLQMREKIRESDPLDMNITVFEADELDTDLMVQTSYSYPVMCDRRLIVIRDLTPKYLTAEVGDALRSVIDDMPDYLTLMFDYTDEKLDPLKSADLKPMFSTAVICRFDPPSSRELAIWIRRNFAAFDKAIDDRVLEYFMDTVDHSMAKLKHEIAKVSSYAKDREITEKHVDDICCSSDEARVFALSDALISGDMDRIYSVLDILVRQHRESPILMLAYLSSVFGNLVKLRAAQDAGISLDAAAREIGFRGNLNNAARTLRKLDAKKLDSLLQLCCETDMLMKSSRLAQQTLLELFFERAAEKVKGSA